MMMRPTRKCRGCWGGVALNSTSSCSGRRWLHLDSRTGVDGVRCWWCSNSSSNNSFSSSTSCCNRLVGCSHYSSSSSSMCMCSRGCDRRQRVGGRVVSCRAFDNCKITGRLVQVRLCASVATGTGRVVGLRRLITIIMITIASSCCYYCSSHR